MSVTVRDYPGSGLSREAIAAWREVPTAIASDELDRAGAADAGLKPIGRPGPIAGPAFTVRAMVADNLAIHHAVALAPPGAVLVIDAGGFDRNAVWGGILHRAAELRGIAGVVIDGCVRDRAEIAASALPCFARGVVPAGPHKGFGGEINATVQIGALPVAPGDLVLGDADGIAVVPATRADALHPRCLARIEAEAQTIRRLEAGETTVAILGLAPPGGS